jgi:hypothetical protein
LPPKFLEGGKRKPMVSPQDWVEEVEREGRKEQTRLDSNVSILALVREKRESGCATLFARLKKELYSLWNAFNDAHQDPMQRLRWENLGERAFKINRRYTPDYDLTVQLNSLSVRYALSCLSAAISAQGELLCVLVDPSDESSATFVEQGEPITTVDAARKLFRVAITPSTTL